MDDQTKTDQEKMQDFVNEYNALCGKHKLQIGAKPDWIMTNHGSYEMVVQLSVVKAEGK